jgi:hypothetical protein
LANIKEVGSEKQLECARQTLVSALEDVYKFVDHYGDAKADFQSEANRRIKSTRDLLAPRPPNADGVVLPLSRRVLVKAQSNLQEIMNSAAAISLTQAKENLNSLDMLTRSLKRERDLQIQIINPMEAPMQAIGLAEDLAKLREDCDVVNSDAGSKLRDATKRWNAVKNQSAPRKVVEYIEEEAPRLPVGIDPKNMLKNTHNQLNAFGAKSTTHVQGAVNVAGRNLQGIAEKTETGVKGAFEQVKNVGKEIKSIFTSDDERASSPPPQPSQTQKKSAIPNPFEGMMGGGASGGNGTTPQNRGGQSRSSRGGAASASNSSGGRGKSNGARPFTLAAQLPQPSFGGSGGGSASKAGGGWKNPLDNF